MDLRGSEGRRDGFSGIAARYGGDSLIQRSAAEKLLGLLRIGGDDDVLDLGCGTGNLTRKICGMTAGRAVGVDPSEAMIREAQSLGAGRKACHFMLGAEEMVFEENFDVIFCNSAFQWFRDPATALRNCFAALRAGGRMGIQAPARQVYCPNFVTAIEAVARDPGTRGVFAGFKPPWFFLETAGDYAALFAHAGFRVTFAVIEEVKTFHSVEEVMTVFESGAAAGYLNQACYDAPIDAEYCTDFRRIVKDAFAGQADGHGRVELMFNRIYLVGVKE